MTNCIKSRAPDVRNLRTSGALFFSFLLRQARQKEALPQKRAAARCAIFRVWGFPTGKRREEKLTSLYCLRISKFADPAYKDLSTGAKLLYSLMLDRVMLSTLNEWKEKRGAYFYLFHHKRNHERNRMLQADRCESSG